MPGLLTIESQAYIIAVHSLKIRASAFVARHDKKRGGDNNVVFRPGKVRRQTRGINLGLGPDNKTGGEIE